MRLLKGVKVPLYSCSPVQTEAEEDAESCRIGELDRREVTLFVYLLRPRKPISGGTLYLNPAGWVGLTPLCPVFTALYCPDSYQVPSLRGDGSMDQTPLVANALHRATTVRATRVLMLLTGW